MNQKTREALENEAKYILELEGNYIPLNIWSIKLLAEMRPKRRSVQRDLHCKPYCKQV